MTTRTWNGLAGDWLTPDNWTPHGVPASSDNLIVKSGSPTIGGTSPDIESETIQLGGTATLTLTYTNAGGSATFDDDTILKVTGGSESSSSRTDATLIGQGKVDLEGIIFVQAIHGVLTISAQTNPNTGDAGNITFVNSDTSKHFTPKGELEALVGGESNLNFEGVGATITNDGLIQVEGGINIAAGLTFKGNGIVALQNNGQMSISGRIDASQEIDFGDGTGTLIIASGADVRGVIGFTAAGGDRIDLTGVQAQSEVVSDDKLALYSGPNGTGTKLAELHVQKVDATTLNPSGHLHTADFTLGSDGNGGTLVTYTPQATTYLYQAMPTPVVASAGTMVSLSQILQNSFGSTNPFANEAVTLITASSAIDNPADNQGYWASPGQTNDFVTPTWYVNGQPISSDYTVQPGDDISLLAGNEILPIQLEVQVTPPGSATAIYVTYDIWMVDPRVSDDIAGTPTPAEQVASAAAFNQVFGAVPNTNYCNLIADNVAAAAGAPVSSITNYALDPTLNQAGGFWRIVYAGTRPSPLQNWSTQVEPGDVVRMGWEWPGPHDDENTGGHTTTVLVGGGPGNTAPLTVYDNIYYVGGNGNDEAIGIHSSNEFAGNPPPADGIYWEQTDPADTTIYRLDPKQQYLIQGTAPGESAQAISTGQFIQGSIYNNLIQPGGGPDTITAGAGNNEIQDKQANLNGITVTDFHLGDTFDFTDIAPANIQASYANGTLMVLDNSDGQQAIITMPAPGAGQFIATASDGDGGTFVGFSVAQALTQSQFLASLGPNISGAEATQILNYLQQNKNLYQTSLATAAIQQSASPSVDPFADIAEFSGSAIAPITTATSVSAVIVTALNATVALSGSNNVLLASGNGNDLLNLQDVGDDMVMSGDGNDTILTGQGSDTVQAGDGDDQIWVGLNGIEGDTEVTAGDGNDTIADVSSGQTYFPEGNNLFQAGAGDDSLYAGGSGDDTLEGGADIRWSAAMAMTCSRPSVVATRRSRAAMATTRSMGTAAAITSSPVVTGMTSCRLPDRATRRSPAMAMATARYTGSVAAPIRSSAAMAMTCSGRSVAATRRSREATATTRCMGTAAAIMSSPAVMAMTSCRLPDRATRRSPAAAMATARCMGSVAAPIRSSAAMATTCLVRSVAATRRSRAATATIRSMGMAAATTSWPAVMAMTS